MEKKIGRYMFFAGAVATTMLIIKLSIDLSDRYKLYKAGKNDEQGR